MSNGVVAKRYALALFELSKEQNILEQVEAELRVMKELFETEKEFVSILLNPKFEMAKKKELVKEAFLSVSTPVLNTIMLLIERHRTTIIPELTEQFVLLANEERSVAEATVYSARALSNAEEEQLSNVFAKKVGKASLKIENKVDPSILGGLKIRIGNTIYDGSLAGKLDRIERQLISSR